MFYHNLKNGSDFLTISVKSHHSCLDSCAKEKNTTMPVSLCLQCKSIIVIVNAAIVTSIGSSW